MLGFYVHKYFSLYNGWIKTFHINNETILHFINIWYKEVPLNTSYPTTVNQIDGYLDASISPSFFNIYHHNGQTNKFKSKKINKSKGGDIHRLLQKKNLQEKCATIYGN